MGEHRKHHCHEQIAAAFGKLINPRCSRSTQCVELLWGFVGILCIYRVTSHNYVLNAAPYASLSRSGNPFRGWQRLKEQSKINCLQFNQRSLPDFINLQPIESYFIYEMIALILLSYYEVLSSSWFLLCYHFRFDFLTLHKQYFSQFHSLLATYLRLL